jgi:hypothetical protein
VSGGSSSSGEVYAGVGSSSSVAEQARLELSVAASAGQRANRPMHLIALGGVLLAVATLYLLYHTMAWWSQQAALDAEVARTAKVRQIITAYTQTVEQANSRIFDPDPGVGAKLESLMEVASLPRVAVAVQDGLGTLARGAKQKTYSATLTDQDPEPVLKWIDLALHGGTVNGLTLASLDMRPGKPMESGYIGWNVIVRFTRWERVESR